jgi:threonine dehydrogenase-like Zn-dependent dehydrogenase
VLPRDAEEKESDYVMLADIFPTGYHATELAGVQAGESVVIYGAGPVGLMAALSSTIKGASQVMSSTRTRTGSRSPRSSGRSPSTTPRATASRRSWS